MKRTPTEADALAMRKALEIAGGWGQADIRPSGWHVQKVPLKNVLMPLTSRATTSGIDLAAEQPCIRTRPREPF